MWVNAATGPLSRGPPSSSPAALASELLPLAEELLERDERELARVREQGLGLLSPAAPPKPGPATAEPPGVAAEAEAAAGAAAEAAPAAEGGPEGNGEAQGGQQDAVARRMEKRLRTGSSQEEVDAWVSPDMSMVDPHSFEGFQCNRCGKELANQYLHCQGCEVTSPPGGRGLGPAG